ncbi:MAG: SDR family NAD(P)-dependent oxidoreductase, partial [Actinomycetota bacterium]
METPDTASNWPRYPGLTGRVALVTGGSKALGAAACHALAANGVAVAVGGRDQAALDNVVTQITAAGGRAVAVPGDVTDPATMQRIRQRAEDELGPVQILLPFAGGQGLPTPTTELGLDRWRAVIDSDLTSVYLTIAAFLPGMMERGGGTIVTMASTAGRLPGQANAAYAAAKAGVVMLTKHLAREVAGHGIR